MIIMFGKDSVETILKTKTPVVIFDGKCNLCSTVVKFTLRHEEEERFNFAPIESDIGQELLDRFDYDMDENDSFVIIDKGDIYDRSSASVRLLKGLESPLPLLGTFLKLVPKYLRDKAYRVVADSRYKLFGKRESCMVPEKRFKSRFLN